MKPHLKLRLDGQIIVLSSGLASSSDIDRSFDRLMKAVHAPTLEALATALECSIKTLRVWRHRGRVPDAAILRVSRLTDKPVAFLQGVDAHAPRDWHPADIIAALKKEGTSLRQLAKQNGYSHFQRVMSRPWLAAEQIVARALGCSAAEIWPSRYVDPSLRLRAFAMTRKVSVARPIAASARGAV